MEIERLVAMANQIGDFFGAEPDAQEAATGAFTHLRRFWEPRMRTQIIAHLERGGAGLNDTARAAVARLAEDARAPAAAGTR
jgi:formate dehydrogenase subunit delta